MSSDFRINKTDIKLLKGDISAMEVDAFVFYARTDLSLGSGYGNAISTRGGPSIKKQLDKLGNAEMSQAVVTESGELKSKYIIHAVGPGFQEQNIDTKLKQTVLNALKAGDNKKVQTLAIPIMGIGFYGIDPALSVSIMFSTIKDYLKNGSNIKEVIICANDNRELRFLEAQKNMLN